MKDTTVDEVAQQQPCGAHLSGPCCSRETPGTAVIEDVSPAPEDQYNCHNSPVIVRFSFIPNDAADGGMGAVQGWQYSLSGGANPPASCLELNGIKVGARFPATRLDTTSGSCAPVILEVEFPAEESCLQGCWNREDM